jgi:phage terminase Nu1 subunit (DNA packaging protein)
MPTYSVEAARAWRAQHVAPVPGAKPAEPAAGLPEAAMATTTRPAAYEASRARREAAEAAMAELREGELRGELIRVEAVRAVWASRIVSTRDALLQIPSRLAPVLAAETNLATVTQLLDDELRQALEQLSTPTTATTEGNPHVATH